MQNTTLQMTNCGRWDGQKILVPFSANNVKLDGT